MFLSKYSSKKRRWNIEDNYERRKLILIPKESTYRYQAIDEFKLIELRTIVTKLRQYRPNFQQA